MKLLIPLLLSVVLMTAAGCRPKHKEVTQLERMKAANLVSEAQFAITLRDYARAEPLYAQAADLCPDTGEYWINLGVTRMRLGNQAGAKTAYERARDVYRDLFESDPKQTDALLQEVYALALLGRPDDARQALAKARKKLPDDNALRGFAETQQLDHILADPSFKDIALKAP